MNPIKFLWAAYIATWVIHSVYIGSVARRYRRLRQRMRELGKGK
jgi:CcmD family protein